MEEHPPLIRPLLKFKRTSGSMNLCTILFQTDHVFIYVSIKHTRNDIEIDIFKIPKDLAKHYENMPIQIYRKFHLQKLKIFR